MCQFIKFIYMGVSRRVSLARGGHTNNGSSSSSSLDSVRSKVSSFIHSMFKHHEDVKTTHHIEKVQDIVETRTYNNITTKCLNCKVYYVKLLSNVENYCSKDCRASASLK